MYVCVCMCECECVSVCECACVMCTQNILDHSVIKEYKTIVCCYLSPRSSVDQCGVDLMLLTRLLRTGGPYKEIYWHH